MGVPPASVELRRYSAATGFSAPGCLAVPWPLLLVQAMVLGMAAWLWSVADLVAPWEMVETHKFRVVRPRVVPTLVAM